MFSHTSVNRPCAFLRCSYQSNESEAVICDTRYIHEQTLRMLQIQELSILNWISSSTANRRGEAQHYWVSSGAYTLRVR